MKSYLYLCQYNNYFNRRIKKAGDDLSAYNDYVKAIVSTANFDYADGLNTSIIINSNQIGDYLLVIDSDILPADDSKISSRWFVIEQRKIRGNQYQLILRRDVITDNLESVINAPCFIEKGEIVDPENPLIYNKEGMSFNQIKTSETPLYDKTKCPWLVAYLNKGVLGSATTGTINYDPGDSGAIQLTTSIDQWEFYKYNATNPMKVCDSFIFRWDTYGSGGTNHNYFNNSMTKDGIVNYSSFVYSNATKASNLVQLLTGWYWDPNEANKKQVTEKLYSQCQEIGFDNLNKTLMSDFNYVDQDTLTRLNSYKGKLIRDSSGKYYTIKVNELTIDSTEEFITSEKSTYTTMTAIFNSAFNQTVTPNNYAFRYKATNYKRVIVTIIEQSAIDFNFDLTDTKNVSNEPLYDIICVPYGDITMNLTDSSGNIHTITSSETLSMKLMEGLTKELTSSKVLDLQLLPYCPIPDDIISDKEIKITDYKRIIPCTQNNVFEYGAIVAPSGTFSTAIDKNITINRPTHTEAKQNTWLKAGSTTIRGATSVSITINTGDIYDITDAAIAGITLTPTATISNKSITKTSTSVTVNLTFANAYTGKAIVFTRVTGSWDQEAYDNSLVKDIKASNECDTYRLCSPNYNGVFEFSVAKNGNTVNGFHADCTYKPYNPYIYVHPNFSGLYKQNYEDARGLICGGEFSLGILNDQWRQYEIQNKNYQNIFDRQIQNLDTNYTINKQEAIMQSIAGTLQGGGTGGVIGAALGGKAGSIAGYALGGAASALGGIADINNLNKRYQEQRSFAIDNYHMRLDNIKALPNSITRTSAITANNKKVPFIEYYTCTSIEKDAFLNKLKYDGMTIGVIAALKDYNGGWVKGQLIRLEDIIKDSNTANMIYEEINKGVYL